MNTYFNIKGLLFAAILFGLLHYSITLISNTIPINSTNYLIVISWLNIAAYCNYMLCGFVASSIQKRNYILYGFISGSLSSFIAIAIFGVAGNDSYGILITIILAVILGSIGGLITKLIANKLSTKALTKSST